MQVMLPITRRGQDCFDASRLFATITRTEAQALILWPLLSQRWEALVGPMDLYFVRVILACLELSEFSSHMASAFRCSALSSSALRSSARDKARPRSAGRQSAAEPTSPLIPAAQRRGRDGRQTYLLSIKTHFIEIENFTGNSGCAFHTLLMYSFI